MYPNLVTRICMQVFRTVENLQGFVSQLKLERKKIGFVPTMGALHEGHRSLIVKAYEQCDWVICSIFVNPTQFNDKKDLDKYPRTIEEDKALLADFGDRLAIYNPEISVMYPENQNVSIVDYGYLTSALEAEYRPGHFDGMVDIVRRLLDHVKPDVAFFGQKDYQQLAIIRKLVRDEDIPVGIVGCPIIRENDGLALSSRNVRLSDEERHIALNLNKALMYLKNNVGEKTLENAIKDVKEAYFSDSNIKLEYLECVDAQTLEICETWNDAFDIVCCIAAYVGDIRLIDNMLVKP